MDVGHGSHFSFDMARRALEAGIRPYTLGADMHGYNVHMPQPGMSSDERSANPFAGVAPFNLTIAMTELLALGLELDEMVATVTQQPGEAAAHGGRDRHPGRGRRRRRERAGDAATDASSSPTTAAWRW